MAQGSPTPDSVSAASATGLRTSQDARLSAIVSIAADAIISIDPEQRITLFNTGAEVIFGYSADEILGQPLDILLPEESRERHREHIRAFAMSPINARRMGERSSITARRRSGEIFPAEASISKVRIDGEWMFTVILRDASERKRTEEGLQFLAATGRELNLSLDVVETLERVTRATVPVLADCCAVDLFREDWSLAHYAVAADDPDEDAIFRAKRSRAQGGGTPLYVQRLMRERSEPLVIPHVTREVVASIGMTPEGDQTAIAERLHSVMLFPLKLRSRNPGLMTFFMTHSERGYDETYFTLASELAGRVAIAVDNAELYRRSLEAVAVRDEVVAIVSHDLRNPLSVIKMCASTLSDEPLPDTHTIVDLAHTVHQSAEWMNTIIEDLLDVARIESGKLVMRVEPTRVNEIISQTRTFHETLAHDRGLHLVTEIEDGLPLVSIDPMRMSQVLSNLIGNALKFTERGGTISIRAKRQDGRVVITVSDTGRGISEEDLPKLFDRFWQARRGDLKRGTGLGLAIVKGIVEAHGGRIWVDSAIDRGTTFTFSLLPA